MPSLRSKTVRTENEMVAVLTDESIPALTGSPDYTVNSSGWITIFFNDAHADRGTDVLYEGSASESSFEDALTAGDYTSRINVANAQKIIIGIEVVSGSSAALHLDIRLSNLGNANVSTPGDWFRQLVAPTYASSAYDADVAQYTIKSGLLTTGAKYTLEIPVAANWACIVLHHAHSSAQFKLYADVG